MADNLPTLTPDPIRRVILFLEGLKAVGYGLACLTPLGAEYLGIPFRFPTGVDW